MKKDKMKDFLSSLIIPIFILILWEFFAAHGYIKESLLPRPTKIGSTLIKISLSGKLPKDIFISLKRVLLGYVVGALFGVGMGIILGIFPRVNNAFKVLIEILRPVPIIAWIPVLILVLGIDEKSKIVVIALGTFWPVLLNVIGGIRNVDRKFLEVAQILVKSKRTTIFKVVLPAALPSIFTGLRIASGNALMGVVAAEMFASSSGIGYMISYAREMSQPAKMLAGVFVVGLLGCILNQVVANIEKKQKY